MLRAKFVPDPLKLWPVSWNEEQTDSAVYIRSLHLKTGAYYFTYVKSISYCTGLLYVFQCSIHFMFMLLTCRK